MGPKRKQSAEQRRLAARLRMRVIRAQQSFERAASQTLTRELNYAACDPERLAERQPDGPPGGLAAASGPAMASSWRDEDEELKAGGARVLGNRPRFSFSEIKMLLQEVRRNRYILLRKFNHGVPAEAKKQKWAEITEQINGLGQNHREVRQIMKKWADLKCDGKRRMALLRAPDGSAGRRKRKSLDSVEKMVHRILLMSPTGDDVSDAEDRDEGSKAADAERYSYADGNSGSLSLPGGLSLDFSPLSSPDKDLSGDPYRSSDDDEPSMDCEDNAAFSVHSSLGPPRLVHTYSRHSRNAVSTTSKDCDGDSPPASPLPPSSAAVTSSCSPSLGPLAGDASLPATSSNARPRPKPSPAEEEQALPSPPSGPLPPSGRPPAPGLAELACHSVQQQRASRQLLASVSRSLETLAQSLQLLVESQQKFVSESLALQRETLGVLKTFSGAALAVLRDGRAQGPALRLDKMDDGALDRST
ncbi:serine/arginine repetitive matrix protein 2-like isoform X2 [Syngnathus acus]|uniref:serine/arginine repetitive matrix protein 2-like isoform X2 n=1 Tax=Syngnathus acus TaxID=161584 RepID=UPI001885E98B|nr:serine/arginine repetitive matrix protein 2-like isoform X2 [Syngnathus acus]